MKLSPRGLAPSLTARVSRAAGLAAVALLFVAAPAPAAPALQQLRYGMPAVLGTQANRDASLHTRSISADGRHVVFSSDADNLVPGLIGHDSDVFLSDRQTGTLVRVAPCITGMPVSSGNAAISADGRRIAFVATAMAWSGNVFPADRAVCLHDRDSGLTQRLLPPGQQPAFHTVEDLSADGSHVLFTSTAPGGGIEPMLYLWTVANGAHRADVGDDGLPYGGRVEGRSSISGDGRYIAFTLAHSSFQIWSYVRDTVAGTTRMIVLGNQTPAMTSSAFSADGRVLAFSTQAGLLPADTGGSYDVYVLDRSSGVLELASVDSQGLSVDRASGAVSLSADGRRVAFVSEAINLHSGARGEQVYLRDRVSGTTGLVSRPPGGVFPAQRPLDTQVSAAISADGSQIAFASPAADLVAGDSNRRRDVFVATLPNLATTRVNLAPQPQPAGAAGEALLDYNHNAVFPIGDSGAAVFASKAENLAADRLPGFFRHDSNSGATQRLPVDAGPVSLDGPLLLAAGASADGRKQLLLRQAIDENAFSPGNPQPAEPYDLWLVEDGAARRIDRPELVGGAGRTRAARLSDDGRFVVFWSGQLPFATTPVVPRLLRYDSVADTLQRIDVNAAGVPVDQPIRRRWGLSRNGRFVVFATAANNLDPADTDSSLDLYLRDLASGSVTRLRDPHSGAALIDAEDATVGYDAVSDDGLVVVFHRQHVVGGPTLFLLDRAALRLSDLCAAATLPPYCRDPSLTASGDEVAFVSYRPLLAQDSNDRDDVYRYARNSGAVTLESVDSRGLVGDASSDWPQLSGSGDTLVFHSMATNWLTVPAVFAHNGALLLKRRAVDHLFADGFQLQP